MAIVQVSGASNQATTSVTTLSISYIPTAGNCVIFGWQGNTSGVSSLQVKDNLGNILTTGPTAVDNAVGNTSMFYQLSVPSGVTGYTATWTTGQQVSIAVEEYSGVLTINTAFNSNATAGNSGTASTVSLGLQCIGNWIIGVLGTVNSISLTGSVGNTRQFTTTGASRIILIDNTSTTFHASITCQATHTSDPWGSVVLELQGGSYLQDGVVSMGFDMDLVLTQFFGSTSGISLSTNTEFGTGYSLEAGIGDTAQWQFGKSIPTGIVGIRIYLTGTGSSGGQNSRLLRWYDASGGNIGQITLQMVTTGANIGSLGFYLGNNTGGTLIGSLALNIISPNTWYYLEAKVTIGSASGAVELRLNGNATPVISVTGVNTRESSNNTFDSIIFEGAAPGLGSCYFDDCYISDTTGVTPLNTYLGAVRVYGQAPNANSANPIRNEFTPTSPLGVNYQNVSNVPQNNSEYNYSNVINTYDMFRFPNVPYSQVLFINEWASLILDNASATRTAELNCSSSSVDSTGYSFPLTNTGALYFNLIQTTDPSTGMSWTDSGASYAELGIKIES